MSRVNTSSAAAPCAASELGHLGVGRHAGHPGDRDREAHPVHRHVVGRLRRAGPPAEVRCSSREISCDCSSDDLARHLTDERVVLPAEVRERERDRAAVMGLHVGEEPHVDVVERRVARTARSTNRRHRRGSRARPRAPPPANGSASRGSFRGSAGATRFGSPFAFGKFGGHGSSPSPSASSRAARSSSGSSEYATSSIVADGSPTDAYRAGTVARVRSAGSTSGARAIRPGTRRGLRRCCARSTPTRPCGRARSGCSR